MGFINGLGAEGFIDNFLKSYATLNADNRANQDSEISRALKKQQLEEYLNKQKMREEMTGMIQNNYSPFFQGDTMTPAGQQKMQGLMPQAIQQQVQTQNDYMPPGTNAVDMAQGLTPGLMSNLKAQGGEQKPLTLQQIMPILSKYDPEKAASIMATSENKDKMLEWYLQKIALGQDYRKENDSRKYEHQDERDNRRQAERIDLETVKAGLRGTSKDNGVQDRHNTNKYFQAAKAYNSDIDKLNKEYKKSVENKTPMPDTEWNSRLNQIYQRWDPLFKAAGGPGFGGKGASRPPLSSFEVK